MWFPKNPGQWALVAIVPFIVCWIAFGLAAAFWITVIGVGGYAAWYFVQNQPAPAAQADVLPPEKGGAVVSQPKAVAVAPKSDFAVPSYDVPHVTFNRTAEGFTVYYKKAKISTHRVLNQTHQAKSASDSVAGLVALGVVGAIHLGQGGTNIEVTREAVIIDGKKMHRRDFGGFHISHTWKGAHLEGSLVVLGYTFGSQSYEFGGGWDERKGTEVAAALNRHLRETPMLGDETVATPDVLREARPSDF